MTATPTPTLPTTPARRMNPWRLELLRLTRSRSGLALAATYLAFGLIGPVLAKYLPDLVKYAQSGVTITMLPPTPKDGVAEYVRQVDQIGLIVLVTVAAGALAFDAHPGLSIFMRSRTRSIWHLVLPRSIVVSLGAVIAYTVGTLIVWYETALLIGAPPAGPMLAGIAYGCLYLAFAVAVTTLAASLARSTLGTIGIALATLLLLPIAGLVPAVHDWLPSTLATAPVDLLDTAAASHYLGAAGVSVALTTALVALAGTRLRPRTLTDADGPPCAHGLLDRSRGDQAIRIA